MPTDNKFTSGEWKYIKYGGSSGDYGIYSLGERDSDIALVRGNGSDEEVLANVKLFTDAKLMFISLKHVSERIETIILADKQYSAFIRGFCQALKDTVDNVIYKITEDEL